MSSKYNAGTRISEYVLESVLGTGAFGEVWRARHHIWRDDEVAIKLPTAPDYVRALQREGVVAHGLAHPNIVRVRGFDPYAETPYLVMDLVRGPSVRAVLSEHREGLPIDIAVRITRAVLDAISAAHEAGVLHRDLKPANVLLDLDERLLGDLRPQDVKLTDFGLGAGNPDTMRSIMQSVSLNASESALVGTLAYMAPELRDGQQEPDALADLYSIGVMFYELLTGERPAGAELPSTVRADVPAALDEVFRRLYARRTQRFESAAAALLALDASARRSPPPPPPIAAGRVNVARRSCPACGLAAAADDQFCTRCGQQLVARVRRCADCGSYPGAADLFCIHCGTRLAS